MRVFIEAISGPYRGKVIQLDPGMAITIGRSRLAEIILADDHELAPVHFTVSCGSTGCYIYDRSSEHGLLRNGERIFNALLSNKDQIDAGGTSFITHLENDVFPTGMSNETIQITQWTPLKELYRILKAQTAPLYALVDAARDSMVLTLLNKYQGDFSSLYDGDAAVDLYDAAPSLVSLPSNSPILEWLIYNGWGKSWGVYLTSHESITRIRKHFRSCLFVESSAGETLYFRFYDPRVLRVFLQSCSPSQLIDFLGPTRSYLMETENPLEMWQFSETIQKHNLSTII